MSDVSENIVPMVVMTGMFAMIYGIAYIRSKENMSMIEKGLNPRLKDTSPKPFANLKWGLLALGAGIGMLTAYFIDMNISHKRISPGGEEYYHDNPAIYFALIAIGGGLGLVISYVIEKKHWLDRNKQ